MGGKFHTLFDAVSRAMAQTPRSSSLVENLNSRLRTLVRLERDRGFADSPVEGTGFELVVPLRDWYR
jgi:hypothetical protein